MTMNRSDNPIAARLREPSTYAGAAVAVGAVPMVIQNPRDPQAWAMVLGALFSIFMRERGGS